MNKIIKSLCKYFKELVKLFCYIKIKKITEVVQKVLQKHIYSK